jgi:hypothetical protein
MDLLATRLELEAGAELHLERIARRVIEQQLAELRGVWGAISNLKEVRIRRPEEAARRVGRARAEIRYGRPAQFQIHPVEEVEYL